MIKKLNFSKPLNIIFSGVLCTLIAVWLIISASQWSDITDSYHKINSKHINNVSLFIRDALHNYEYALDEIINASPDFSLTSYNENRSNVKKLLMTQLKMMPNVLAIIEGDAKGNYIRVPSLDKSLRGINEYDPRTRPWFHNASADSDKALFTSPYDDYVLNKKIISISRPILREDSSTSGVLALDLDLDFLVKILHDLTPPVSGDTFILARDGLPVIKPLRFQDDSMYSEFLKKSVENDGYFYHEATHSYYYYKSIANPKWVIFYKVDKNTLNGLAFHESIKVTYGVGFALIILIFSWWGVKSIVDSIFMSIASSLRYGKFEGLDAASLLLNELRSTSEHIETITEKTLTDSLTGLRNRRSFDTDLEKIEHHKKSFIAMMDIDNFKQVNDVYGHATGDVVLKSVATLAIEEQSNNVMFYRYGGEEFAVIFKNSELDEAYETLERLRKKVEQRQFREPGLNVTLSVGLCSLHNTSVTEAVEKADSLLYEAKKSGKNKTVINV